MSSFAGVTFKVVVEDDVWMPDIERGSDGMRRYSCLAQFASRGALADMRDRYSIVDLRQVLGSLKWDAHLQAGYGPSTLSVMIGHKQIRTASAYLTGYTKVEGTGRQPVRFRAQLEFAITP